MAWMGLLEARPHGGHGYSVDDDAARRSTERCLVLNTPWHNVTSSRTSGARVSGVAFSPWVGGVTAFCRPRRTAEPDPRTVYSLAPRAAYSGTSGSSSEEAPCRRPSS